LCGESFFCTFLEKEKNMSVPVEIVEFLKQSLLPEISEIKADIAELKGDIKIINGRLDLIDKRFDDVDRRFDEVDKRFEQMHEQMRDMKDEIREIRSYVWSSGTAEFKRVIAESQAQYRTKPRES